MGTPVDMLAIPKRDYIDNFPTRRPSCVLPAKALPAWTRLPLHTKIPLVWGSSNPVVLTRLPLCCTLRRTFGKEDMDTSDPKGLLLSFKYYCLHDPHLKRYFNKKANYQHLVRNGFVVPSTNGVVCTLEEFNRYRVYCRYIMAMEENYRRKLEEEEMKREKEKKEQLRYLRIFRDTKKLFKEKDKKNKERLKVFKENEALAKRKMMAKYQAKMENQTRLVELQLKAMRERRDVRLAKAKNIDTEYTKMKYQDEERRNKLMEDWLEKQQKSEDSVEQTKKTARKEKDKKEADNWLRREAEEKEWLQREDELIAENSKLRGEGRKKREWELEQRRQRDAARHLLKMQTPETKDELTRTDKENDTVSGDHESDGESVTNNVDGGSVTNNVDSSSYAAESLDELSIRPGSKKVSIENGRESKEENGRES